MGRVLVGSFESEEDVVAAVRAARQRGLGVVDVYAPYAAHGLGEALGLRPSRLPWACFGLGALGVALGLVFPFWMMNIDWPVNVGGKPRNLLPAFLPVVFEMMVLFAGLGVVLAFLLRCGLYPGKKAAPHFRGATDDRFVLVLEGHDATARRLLEELHAVHVEERQG
jgi:hypothetical protein